jgi:S1-C subfamily serine protease
MNASNFAFDENPEALENNGSTSDSSGLSNVSSEISPAADQNDPANEQPVPGSISVVCPVSVAVPASTSLSDTTTPESTSKSPVAPSAQEHVRNPSSASLLLSTVLSLSVVLVLLLALRVLLPTMLEMSRYAWFRGQLRAEYEAAGQELSRVSLDGLSISQHVARRVCPSVVHVTLDHAEPSPAAIGDESSLPIRKGPRRSMVGQGSGVIVDARGYILTNFHVINDEDAATQPRNINVLLADDRTCKAELIGFDADRDLAVLKIDADDLLPITWGDSELMEIGSPVWAVGSPFGLTGSITFGILSGKHRLDLSGTSYDEQRLRQRFLDDTPRNKHLAARYTDLMQSDVAVNPGNSGGPLVNGRGEMIGINTAIIGEAYRGVSFSIPSSVARMVFEQIVANGKMKPGWLGVVLVKVSDWQQQMGPPIDASSLGSESGFDDVPTKPKLPTRGAVIRRILSPDSPAALAGLQVGDLILALNDEYVKGVEDLIFAIGKQPAGTTIQLLVERNGQRQNVSVQVTERPEIR